MVSKTGDQIRSISDVPVRPFLKWFWSFSPSNMTGKVHTSKVLSKMRRMTGCRAKSANPLRNDMNSDETIERIFSFELKAKKVKCRSSLNGHGYNATCHFFRSANMPFLDASSHLYMRSDGNQFFFKRRK